MADSRAKELLKIGDALFDRKRAVDALNQEIALNCYTERADFTTAFVGGEDFSSHLFASYPSLARRELGNSFSSLLRPINVPWATAHVEDEELDKQPAERKFLEGVTKVMRRAMYDPLASFVRATKSADHDVAAFGNAVLEARIAPSRRHLVFFNHHLRDNAWSENAFGKIDANHRKWNPTARQLMEWFPQTASKAVKDAYEKEPEKVFECRHVVVPTRMYEPDVKPGSRRMQALPFTCLYMERESETILEETPEAWFPFVIPRWQLISGSQYGLSPATIIGLPDQRTFQVVVRTLREAGEMHVNPPMVYRPDALRGDLELFAGGATAVEMEYDEQLGDPLRAVDRNAGNMPIGFEIAASLRDDIRLAFFLDKVTLPPLDPQKMTAFEFQQRIQQMAREGAPIFDPIEDDYNAPVCNLVFEMLKANGAFGPAETVPETLRGAEIRFQFRSPLREAQEQAQAGTLIDGLTRVVMPAVQLDPSLLAMVNLEKGMRDALHGIGFKEDWLNPESAVEERRSGMAEQAKMQQGVATMGAGGAAAKDITQAMKNMAQPSA